MQYAKLSFVLAAMTATAVAGNAAANSLFDFSTSGPFGGMDTRTIFSAEVDGFTATLSNPRASGGTLSAFGNGDLGLGVSDFGGNFDDGESFQLSFDQDVYLVAVTNQAVDEFGIDTDNDNQNDLFILDTIQLSVGGTNFLFGDVVSFPEAVNYGSFGVDDTASGLFPMNTLVPANTPITISNVTGGGFFRVQSIEIAPVPEPTSLVGLAGLAGLGLRRRR